MQTGAWIALLHQIPKNQHDNLIFTTIAGLEIAVHGIQRIEADYVLVRGRQTGTPTEGGGFYFIPYDHILFLGFQKVVKEKVIRSIYGDHSAADQSRVEAPEPTAVAEPTAVEDQGALEPSSPGTPVAAARPTPSPEAVK